MSYIIAAPTNPAMNKGGMKMLIFGFKKVYDEKSNTNNNTIHINSVHFIFFLTPQP